MNKLLFFCPLFLIGSVAFGQDPDPDLFQTWYLYEVLDGDDVSFEVYLIDPPVTPYITISEDLDFTGEGACNTFSGTFSLPFQGQLEPNNFTHTIADCGFSIHNAFEDSYFGFMGREQGYSYQIVPEGEGLRLHLSEPFDGFANFRNFQLSTPDFELDAVLLYPNPTNSQIFISSEKHEITKMELYNLLGESVQTWNDNVESIDIRHLNAGVYLLRLYSDSGSVVKQIIKN